MRSATNSEAARSAPLPTARPRRSRTLVLLVALLAGCVRQAETSTVYDLIEHFPLAEPQRQIDRLDFASSAAEPHLLEGWAARSSRDGSARWGLGASSAFRFFLAPPGPLTLVARGRPFKVAKGSPQQVRLRVNGHSELAPVLHRPPDFRWEIPASACIAGENRVTFTYAEQWIPRAHREGSMDSRPLAVAWEWIRLVGSSESRAASLSSEVPDVLLLPFQSQLDYYLFPPELAGRPQHVPASLAIEAVMPRGAQGEGRLVIEFEGDVSHDTSSLELPLSEVRGGLLVPLPAVQGPIRLSLRALGADASGGIELLAPRVVAPYAQPDPRELPREEASAPSRAKDPRPNIVVYIVDTLRRDHLGIYGYDRAVTPRIDAWARTATVFDSAYANSSWTRPSAVSIFTGLDPLAHRIASPDDALPSDAVTLAELLADAGYETAAWVTNPNVSEAFGFEQGFDTFVFLAEDLASPEIFASAGDLNAAAKAWLEGRRGEVPYLLYLHATDPHSPYVPPERYRRRWAAEVEDPSVGYRQFMKELSDFKRTGDRQTISDLEALYDAEIAFLDAEFGRLVELLRERGELADTLLVFVSDHGEEFFDHGWWEHGKTLFEEQIRIPLIVGFPGGRGSRQRVSARVEQIDILPTVLRAVGLAPLDEVQGRDLWSVTQSGRDLARPAIALFDRGGRQGESVIHGSWKLIQYGAYKHPLGIRPTALLFDLSEDPAESRDLTQEHPVMAGYLRSLLRSASERRPALTPRRATIDLSIEKRLRALGYIQ